MAWDDGPAAAPGHADPGRTPVSPHQARGRAPINRTEYLRRDGSAANRSALLPGGPQTDLAEFECSAAETDRAVTVVSGIEYGVESRAGDPGELVTQHASIVHQEARRFTLSKLDRSDLHQAGFAGLLIAAARFDHEAGPFEPYARLWVRKEMQRAVAGAEFSAVMPADLVGRVVALRRLADASPSLDVLAAQVGLSRTVTESLLGSLVVDLPTGEVPHPMSEPAEATAIRQVVGAALNKAVAQLPDECRAVVVDHYGLGGREPGSLRAISRRLGISPSTTRSRLDRGLAQLRRLLGEGQPKETFPMPARTASAAEWPAYGFAIDLPTEWEVFPGDGTNGSVAQIRTGTGPLDLALNIWKLPSQGANPDQFVDAVRPRLEAGNYSDFDVTSIDAPEGFDGRRLSARQKDGWTTIQHYFSRGAATYIIGWGTERPEEDKDVIERITATFRALN